MAIVFYNTLSKRKEEFETLEPGVVRLYSCGPTVHDFAHIGNFRAFVFVDVLRRHLELRGYEVRHVMNITDVGHMTTDADEGEDKIGKSAREKGMTPWEVVETFSKAFFEDIQTLRLRPAMVYPRATEHVPDMVRLVERILANGYAYEANGSVYFEEARLVLECRKLYFHDLEPANFIDESIMKNYPKNDFHRMYVGEITRVLVGE